jgi:hypothetical protein
VAPPKWKWMAGMAVEYLRDRPGAGRAGTRDRVESVDEDYGVKLCDFIVWCSPDDVGIPDLADPATQGCLWAMLDGVAPGWLGWTEYLRMEPPVSRGEALARALLAAWGDE